MKFKLATYSFFKNASKVFKCYSSQNLCCLGRCDTRYLWNISFGNKFSITDDVGKTQMRYVNFLFSLSNTSYGYVIVIAAILVLMRWPP